MDGSTYIYDGLHTKLKNNGMASGELLTQIVNVVAPSEQGR